MNNLELATCEVARYLPALTRYARKLCRNHPEDAEDVIQATVERALGLNWASGQVRDPEAYLIRTVRNIYLDRLRKLSREHPTGEDALAGLAVPGNQDMALLCNDTLKAIARMPAPMRRLMHMAACGESYRDMANALDVPVGTVTSRLARARAELAAEVGWTRRAA